MQLLDSSFSISIDTARMLSNGDIYCKIKSYKLKKEFPHMDFAILIVDNPSIVEIWNSDGSHQEYTVTLDEEEYDLIQTKLGWTTATKKMFCS